MRRIVTELLLPTTWTLVSSVSSPTKNPLPRPVGVSTSTTAGMTRLTTSSSEVAARTGAGARGAEPAGRDSASLITMGAASADNGAAAGWVTPTPGDWSTLAGTGTADVVVEGGAGLPFIQTTPKTIAASAPTTNSAEGTTEDASTRGVDAPNVEDSFSEFETVALGSSSSSEWAGSSLPQRQAVTLRGTRRPHDGHTQLNASESISGMKTGPGRLAGVQQPDQVVGGRRPGR
jgi:hypothetical protein